MPETLNKPTVKGLLLGHDSGSNMLEVYALIMAAKLKGGGITNMSGAWDLLQNQKPWIGAVLQSSAQAAPYFANDQVWLTPYWSGRAGYYANMGIRWGSLFPMKGQSESRGYQLCRSGRRTKGWRSSSSISC